MWHWFYCLENSAIIWFASLKHNSTYILSAELISSSYHWDCPDKNVSNEQTTFLSCLISGNLHHKFGINCQTLMILANSKSLTCCHFARFLSRLQSNNLDKDFLQFQGRNLADATTVNILGIVGVNSEKKCKFCSLKSVNFGRR